MTDIRAGAYAIWLTVKGLSIIFEWLPQGGRRLATAAMDVLKLVSLMRKGDLGRNNWRKFSRYSIGFFKNMF